MPIQRPRASLLLLGVFAGASAACGPKPSTTPLGLGPLALAEQASLAQRKPAAARPHSAARAASAPAAPIALATKSNDDDDSATEHDASSEKPSAESKSKAKAAPAFAGLFAGKDVAIFRISGMPERQELDDKARIRVESESATQLRVVLINSEDGSDLCELSAEVQGSAATIDGGQPCFSSEGEGAIHAELTSGTVVLNGDRLSMDAEGSLSVAVGDDELDGDLSYSFKGKRQ